MLVFGNKETKEAYRNWMTFLWQNNLKEQHKKMEQFYHTYSGPSSENITIWADRYTEYEVEITESTFHKFRDKGPFTLWCGINTAAGKDYSIKEVKEKVKVKLPGEFYFMHWTDRWDENGDFVFPTNAEMKRFQTNGGRGYMNGSFISHSKGNPLNADWCSHT